MTDSTADIAARGFGETLTEAVAALDARGYPGQFRVAGPAEVQCLACRMTRPAETFVMSALVRVEGVSDPADEELVAGITCPGCQTRGTLLLSYGMNASREDGAVLMLLQDARAGHAIR